MKTAKKSFAYLVLILGALIMVLPFFWMIISSLKTAAEVNTTPPTFWPKELVFENYVYAFEKAPFLRYFCNSLLVTIVCVACTMFTTILAAFAFSRLKFPGRDLLFSLLLSLMMIPFEMLIITNYTTIVKLGLNDTLIALILPFTSSIFYTYILRNFFLAIPDSLYYSARVDGASNWRYLWRVMRKRSALSPAHAMICRSSPMGCRSAPMRSQRCAGQLPSACCAVWATAASSRRARRPAQRSQRC